MLYCISLFGHRICPWPTQFMRPRRAVLQIPPKSSFPHCLLFHKTSHLLTPSESTLLQVLVPLHFNSSRMNTYAKQGGGPLSTAQKFCNSLLPANHLCAHTPTSATPVPSMLYFIVLRIPINLICPASLVAGRRLNLAGACLRSRGPRVSSLLAFTDFRASARRRFAPQFELIVFNGGAD